MLDPKIQDTVEYHTTQIAKTCKLDAQTTDDVRQELTLTALAAMKNHTPDMSANLLTYVKAALSRGVAGVVRKIKNAPSVANIDNALDLDGIQADPNKLYQPLTISTGNFLEQLMLCNHEYDVDLKLDIEAVLEKLSSRQKTICQMLIAGHTQEEIAGAVGCTDRTIRNEISRIKPLFAQFLKNS